MGLFGNKRKEQAESREAPVQIDPRTGLPVNEPLPPEAQSPPQPETVEDLFAVMPEGLRQAIASIKGREPVANDDVVEVPAAQAFPVAGDEAAREEARRKAIEEEMKNLEIGKAIPGQGVYLGKYTPKDRDGNSLSQTFNVFAAPEDLRDGNKRSLLTYNDTQALLARTKGFHGHDGATFKNDSDLYAALRSGSYNGEWFIPTRDILHGKDVDGNETTPDNILAHWKKGALSGTFCETAGGGDVYPLYYWSSSEPRGNADHVYFVRLSDGFEGWDRKDDCRLSCRPVRMVPAVG
jgi:hypothetical protein